MTDEPITDRGLLTLPEQTWEQGRLRAQIIGPLAAQSRVGHPAADEAAAQLGISRRQVYDLVRRARLGAGLVSEMVPGQSDGGKGRGRLSAPVEQLIREAINKGYINRQKRSQAALCRDITRQCAAQGLKAPARNTIAARITQLDPVALGRRREGSDAIRPLQAAGGTPPARETPLEQVQIDHTVIDLMIVAKHDRQPIGRPYLTVGIDVFSRCIVGLVVTLEPPSAVSVGLCLANMSCDKRPWLEQLAVEAEWPMSGKPRSLYLDNAAEFKSEALRRGCEQHGINLSYRPPGQPHFGGIVERVIGTLMRQIHELPGTTFSNPTERGDYPSEDLAALTLGELERWLALAVAAYHASLHQTLRQTPAAKWAEGIARHGQPPVVTNTKAFLVDFLPVIRRVLTRTGFVIDHVHYFANALKPLIARRSRTSGFLVRRDPRDISRIWVLEPDSQEYLEIPYRTQSYPSVTLWEHRQAVARLHEQGRKDVDEAAVFRAIERMRQIAHDAQKVTKRARRDGERRQHLQRSASAKSPPLGAPQPDSTEPLESATPFDQIETW